MEKGHHHRCPLCGAIGPNTSTIPIINGRTVPTISTLQFFGVDHHTMIFSSYLSAGKNTKNVAPKAIAKNVSAVTANTASSVKNGPSENGSKRTAKKLAATVAAASGGSNDKAGHCAAEKAIIKRGTNMVVASLRSYCMVSSTKFSSIAQHFTKR